MLRFKVLKRNLSYLISPQVWFQNRRAKAKRERHGSSECLNDTEVEITEEERSLEAENQTDVEENKELDVDVD